MSRYYVEEVQGALELVRGTANRLGVEADLGERGVHQVLEGAFVAQGDLGVAHVAADLALDDGVDRASLVVPLLGLVVLDRQGVLGEGGWDRHFEVGRRGGVVQRSVRGEELRLQRERHLRVETAVAVDVLDHQELDDVLGREGHRGAARWRVGHE